jgi:ligand-binding SRPBCC domain-containing protein
MYQFKREQAIPSDINTVWQFISSPRNLSKITPTYMGFEITNEPIADHMYAGMIISYRVKPLLGIPLNWVTEITHIKEFEYFVDEQRVGPYSMWHHQHKIYEIKNGIMMEDIVSYLPPFGILGKISNTLIIKKQLNEIFDYRFQALVNEFGTFPS